MTLEASIPIPFALGEPLWHTGYGHREEWIECPECAGSRALTLIQGNGKEVSIACACCSRGFEDPSGTVKRTHYERTPTRFTPRRVSVSGDEIRYSESEPDATAFNMVYATDLYVDRDECANRCEEDNAKHEKAQDELLLRNLVSKRREMAWSVHYWGRQVKTLERDLGRARERLSASKARKKGEERR